MKPHISVGRIVPISLCVFWTGLSAPAVAQDVALFGVAKTREYVQESSQIVRLNERDGDEPIKFEAFVEVAPTGTVTSASVTPLNLPPPGGSAIALVQNGSEFGYRFATDWPLDIEEDYPNGDYLMQIQTGVTQIGVTLSLDGDAYPNAPRVKNFTVAQAVNSAAEFTLEWDPFTDGTTEDAIEVRIRDATDTEIFNSDPPPGGLDGEATSFLIPAATLSPGSHYSAELVFIKVVDLDETAGPPGVAVYIKQTIVPMATAGTSPQPDTDPPWLQDHRPWNDETDVPVESVVAFQFNEEMETPVSPKLAWSGSGLTPGLFTYHWSADRRRLFAVYGDPVGLPKNTEVSWEINPATGGGSTVSDLAGNPLDPHTGSFHTATDSASTDPDIELVFLAKTQGLFQDASGVHPSGLFGLEAGAEFNVLNALLAGTITVVPGGGTVDLLGDDWLGEDTDIEADYTSKTELDQFFPNGSYHVSLNTAHDGLLNTTLTFPTDSYPNDPTVTGIASLQAVDADQPLTISWETFTGATPGDDDYLIWLWISTESGFDVFESPDPGELEALTGTSTSVIIPAGTLSPGREYEAELEFVRIVDTDDTDDTVFSAAFTKITEFDLQTTGTPIQPRAQIVRSPGSTEIRVLGDRFTGYVLTASSDLQNWHQIHYPMQTWESNEVSFFDWDADYFTERYYQVVENPDPWDSPQLPVSIQGTVFQSDWITPIADALVATSLDGNTATTDANGSFFLQTDTVRPPDQPPYSIIITKAGYQQSNDYDDWGDNPRTLEFTLQPQ